MSSKEIRIRLIALRKHYGMSQQDLADKSGVGVATISNIENGSSATLAVLDKLNSALEGALY